MQGLPKSVSEMVERCSADGLCVEITTAYQRAGKYNLFQNIYKLDDLRAENNRLKERIRALERACDNYDQANCKISRELNETRWQLIKAKRRIEELERISVDWEVVHDDETRG